MKVDLSVIAGLAVVALCLSVIIAYDVHELNLQLEHNKKSIGELKNELREVWFSQLPEGPEKLRLSILQDYPCVKNGEERIQNSYFGYETNSPAGFYVFSKNNKTVSVNKKGEVACFSQRTRVNCEKLCESDSNG